MAATVAAELCLSFCPLAHWSDACLIGNVWETFLREAEPGHSCECLDRDGQREREREEERKRGREIERQTDTEIQGQEEDRETGHGRNRRSREGRRKCEKETAGGRKKRERVKKES